MRFFFGMDVLWKSGWCCCGLFVLVVRLVGVLWCVMLLVVFCGCDYGVVGFENVDVY